MRILLSLLLLAANPAYSADWALRADDRLLSADEVAALTIGETLVFYDDGQSKFSAGGSYSYTYANGGSAYGQFEISTDGTVCIDFRNGFSRCDRYVQNGARVVMLTEKGERFPVRP